LRDAVAGFLQEERLGVLAYAEQARDMLPYRQA
jgi:predicted N-acyltransferase